MTDPETDGLAAIAPQQLQDLSLFRLPPGFRGRSGAVVLLWQIVQATLFAWSPQPFYGWRRLLLRAFGARIGKKVIVRPTARVTYPWKLEIGDWAWVGDHAELYCLGPMRIGAHAVVSQRSYLWWGLGNALSLQGFALVVGVTLGPTALVAFSTIRTMTRIMLQCVLAMHDVITPETSLSFGAGDISTFRQLHNVSCQLALWTAGLITLVAIPLAPLTHHLWTLGRVPFDLLTFVFLMLAVTFQSLWSTSSVTLSAINRHMGVSSVFLVANIIGVSLGSQLARPFGVHAIGALIMIIDGGFAVYVLANVLPVVHERFSTFLKAILTPPLFLLSWRKLRPGV